MKLPPLTEQELETFLNDGTWVAKLATHNADGSIRITPLTYAVEYGTVVFTTWMNSDAAKNVARERRASVLIDRAGPPYAGVHYTGTATVAPEVFAPEEYAQLFARYMGGDLEAAADNYRMLTSLGLGPRASIRFLPAASVTWDFAKLP